MSFISPATLTTRLDALIPTVETISHDANLLDGRLRARATNPGELPAVHSRISELCNQSLAKLEDYMKSCVSKEGRELPGFEFQPITITEIDANIRKIYKRLCNTIRTIAPEYQFPTPDIMAGARSYFTDVVVSLYRERIETPAARDLRACITQAGLDLASLEYREILGDGNCFYTSIATHILGNPELLSRFIEKFTTPDPTRGSSPIDNFDPEYRTSLMEFLTQQLTHPNTEGCISNTNQMMQFIRALREIAADEMISNRGNYENFDISLSQEFHLEQDEIFSAPNYQTLVDNYTKEMGKDASFMTIIALSNALNLPIMIHQVGQPAQVISEDRLLDPRDPQTIHIMKTGEHYYLLHTTPALEDAIDDHRPTPPRTHTPHLAAQAPATAEPSMRARFEVPIDVGFGNRLVLVGSGTIIRDREAVDLSWDNPSTNGIPLNCSSDGKVWCLDTEVLVNGECKICLVEASGNVKWSTGSNMALTQDAETRVPPAFDP